MTKWRALNDKNRLLNEVDYGSYKIYQAVSPAVNQEHKIYKYWDQGIIGYYTNLERNQMYTYGLPKDGNQIEYPKKVDVINEARQLQIYATNIKWLLNDIPKNPKFTIMYFGVSVITRVESRLYIYISATKENFEFAVNTLTPFEPYVDKINRQTVNAWRPFEIKYIRLDPQIKPLKPPIAHEGGIILSRYYCDHCFILNKHLVPALNFYLKSFDMEGAGVNSFDIFLDKEVCFFNVYIGAESTYLWNYLNRSINRPQTYSVVSQLLQVKDCYKRYVIQVRIKDVKEVFTKEQREYLKKRLETEDLKPKK